MKSLAKLSHELHLQNAVWALTLLPEKGACLISGECHGFPVFKPANRAKVEAGGVFASSCFPLLPYSNRIKDGAFIYAGKTYNIKRNHAGNQFPLHGTGWEKPWQVESASETHCDLSLTYQPESGGWPWAFHARQVMRLDGDTLSIQLSIKNLDDEPFPAGLGLHPSFSNAKTAQVKYHASSMWKCDDQLIPIRKIPLAPSTDFSEGKGLQDITIDNCFEGWDGHAEIRWRDFPGAIQMKAGKKFSNLVVYIDPRNDFFCLEPVTHVNNALNMPSVKMKDLKPSETLTEIVTFTHKATPKGRL